MKVVSQSFVVMDRVNGDEVLKKLELCGRTCYKSEDRITNESARKFIKGIIESKHSSVLEHVSITVKVITNRAVSHQLVRHRLASYSQESQRYCNYSKDKFQKEITFIYPSWMEDNTGIYPDWKNTMKTCEEMYLKMVSKGATPQRAREVLPNSTKTEITISQNLRSWRNFFTQRTNRDADEMMRDLVIPMLKEFQEMIPVVFDDIEGGDE